MTHLDKNLMDGIRAVVDQIERDEQALLQQRTQLAARAYAVALLAEVALLLISLVIMGLAWYWTGQEMAARRAAEEHERQERQRWYVTLGSIGDAVICTDLAGRVNYLNKAAEDLTGWTAAEAGGRRLEEVFRIINEETRQSVDNPAGRALREGIITGLANHTLLVTQAGAEIAIDDSASPIRNDRGIPLGAVLVFRDITQRRVLERLRQEHEQALAASQRRKDEFLAVLAHELRNPLR